MTGFVQALPSSSQPEAAPSTPVAASVEPVLEEEQKEQLPAPHEMETSSSEEDAGVIDQKLAMVTQIIASNNTRIRDLKADVKMAQHRKNCYEPQSY